MNRITTLLCGSLFAATGFAQSGTLSLEQALELARQNSPELRAGRIYTEAAQQAVEASGRWMSPELGFEVENFGGDNDGFDDAEYTIGIKQQFQRGGKRKSERDVALSAIGIAGHTASERELDLFTRVRLAFVEVMAQQEIGTVREEQEQLGRAFVEVAKRRYGAGGASELDVLEAELALDEIILSQTCCFGDLLAAQVKLASLVGLPVKELPELVAPYYELETIDGLIVDEAYPALQQMDARIDKLRAEALLARSKDSADLTLAAGYRYEAEGDINTFVVGGSMPLNFVKRGRAQEAATLLEANALQADKEELQRSLQSELAVLVALYNGAKMEAEMTRDMLMPKAVLAYELTRDGYDAGRFSWFELIIAQQHLAEIRVRYIEALQDAHVARAEISKFMKQGMYK